VTEYKMATEFTVEQAQVGKRIDVLLAAIDLGLSRSQAQKLIADGLVLVNGQLTKANYKVRLGDCINIRIPEPQNLAIVPEAIPLDILYEDRDVIVINKPQGMVVHPAAGNYSGTLVNALLAHCAGELSGINGVIRPGIVHRIDKDTSGVLMVAKNDQAHLKLAAQIKAHSVQRRYLALVYGNIKEERGTINAPIGRHPVDRQKMAVTERLGRHAVTHFTVAERFGDYTLLDVALETGRTHQIRVHMAYIGHPVVGDPKYGPVKNHFALPGQFLHAYLLGFIHPTTGEYLEFTAPLPPVMAQVLQRLRDNSGRRR